MPDRETASALLEQLQGALVHRDVRSGFELLDRALVNMSKLDFSEPDSITFLLIMAQWIDLGYRDSAYFDELMVDLHKIDRAQLPMLDFLKLSMVEAYRDLSGEQLVQCIEALDLILRIGKDLLTDYSIFLANFWKGRAHRKRSDYTQARLHLALARTAAERVRSPELTAVIEIHQSWLAFQEGDMLCAFQLLDEAEGVLRSTGHGLSLGNIESARGRFVRRSGEYTRALGHFEAAIGIYCKSYPNHPNLARALVNAAYVKRLIALDLLPQGGSGRARGLTHAKSFKISQEALALLERAGEIYDLHHHQAGTGSVLVLSAHLHLDHGNIDQASIKGKCGFDLGEETRDQILMARSRIVQATIELAQAEEQVGEQTDVARHANLAIQQAEHAIELALETQNKRLLAAAYITRGLAAAADYFQQWEIAKEYAVKAAALLNQNDRDHLYKKLGDLKSKLVGATRVEETLRQWSDGQVGDKTFRQIQEEFAELVIPKVWLQNGRNVTSVAKSLSISPKK